MNFTIRPNEARAYSRLPSYYFTTVCRDVITTLAILRGGILPLFYLALSNTDYSVDCEQITLSVILLGLVFSNSPFTFAMFHVKHYLLPFHNGRLLVTYIALVSRYQ